MREAIPRSWLIVPASRPAQIDVAVASGAEAVVLDLAEFARDQDKPAARKDFEQAIARAGREGAAVHAMIDSRLPYADLTACVRPGLAGVVLAGIETAAAMREADEIVGALELERGLTPGSVSLVPAFETARGNQDAWEILRASRRVRAATLGRVDLVMDLRPEPDGEIHLLPYLMQRLVMAANAVGATPLGAWWHAPDRGLLASAQSTWHAVRRGRAIGFKGTLCLSPEQVAPIHRAFEGVQA